MEQLVLEHPPEKVFAYKAPKREKRLSPWFSTMAGAVAAWNAKTLTDEEFAQVVAVLGKVPGATPLRKPEFDYPDAAIPAGTLWRWLQEPTDAEQSGVFVCETEIKGSETVTEFSNNSTKEWHRDSQTLEHPGARELPVKNAHLVKNHCVGRLTYNQFRRAVWGINQKQDSEIASEKQDAEFLKYIMDNQPLGSIIEDPDVAAAYVRVADAPAPTWTAEQAVLKGYAIPAAEVRKAGEVESEKNAVDPWSLEGVPEKIEGWSPTNAYIGTVKDSYTSANVELTWKDNTIKHARAFTTGSAYTIAAGAMTLKVTGTVVGELTMKVYTGTPDSYGSLLGTYIIDILELGTALDWRWFGGSVAALANATVYTLELSTTATLDDSNYLTIRQIVGGGVAGNQNWSYSGGSWSSSENRFNFITADNSDGGKCLQRVDGNFSAWASTIKGSAIAATDTGTCVLGATITMNSNAACLQWRIGETVTGSTTPAYAAAVATYRYGSIIVSAGVTVTFTGNATATNSGFLSNPSSADTSSKQSVLTINGTAGSPTIFTNSAGAYNTNNKWTIAWTYGLCAMGVWQAKYPCSAACFMTIPATSTYTTATSFDLGTCTLTTGAIATGIGHVQGAVAGQTVPVDLGHLFMDCSDSTTSSLNVYPWGYSANQQGANNIVRWKSLRVLGPNHANGARLILFNEKSSGALKNLYLNACVIAEELDVRGTQVVPTGLAIADLGNGKGGLATITNRVAYADTDELIVTSSAGVVIGRCTFAEYDLNSGCICPNVTLGAARNGDKCKATSDLSFESAYSDPAAEWTPTAGAIPVFSGITSLTDNADGTLTARWGAATGEDEFEIHVKPAADFSGSDIADKTYLAGAADADATSQRICNTAAGAKLTAGVDYYVRVLALNGAGTDGNAVSKHCVVTNPYALINPAPIVPGGNEALLGATETVIYTCPTTKKAIAFVMANNISSDDRAINLWKVSAGGSASNAKRICCPDYTLALGDPPFVSPLVQLAPGDSIRGTVDVSGNANAIVTAIEETLQ